MKISSFSPFIGMSSFKETPWGKGVIFFIAGMILLNTVAAGPSLSSEKREMLHKIVAAQSTMFQFFSFSTLPILAVDNLLKRSGLGTPAPVHPSEDSQPAGSQCDLCFARPSVENSRPLLKIFLFFMIPSLACALMGSLLSSRVRERWRDARQTIARTGLFFFLLPRNAVGDEGFAFFTLNTSARPDYVRPGIFMPCLFSINGGGL